MPNLKEEITKAGIILSPEERWEKGIDHHQKSIELFKYIADIDDEYNQDMFCWKSGGDGDNGESLMFLMDSFFEHQDLILVQ